MISKTLAARRQAIRLHIEAMKNVDKELHRRMSIHRQDVIYFDTTDKAIKGLEKKIVKAQRELAILEDHWTEK